MLLLKVFFFPIAKLELNWNKMDVKRKTQTQHWQIKRLLLDPKLLFFSKVNSKLAVTNIGLKQIMASNLDEFFFELI